MNSRLDWAIYGDPISKGKKEKYTQPKEYYQEQKH